MKQIMRFTMVFALACIPSILSRVHCCDHGLSQAEMETTFGKAAALAILCGNDCVELQVNWCKSPWGSFDNECDYMGCVAGMTEEEADCGFGTKYSNAITTQAMVYPDFPEIYDAETGPFGKLCKYKIVCSPGNYDATKSCRAAGFVLQQGVEVPRAGSCIGGVNATGCRGCSAGARDLFSPQETMLSDTFCSWCDNL